MNNNQQCPICRSPLSTLICKKCGYQEKKLKIVETQQQFGKVNYFNKIQGVRSTNKKQNVVSAQEKLKIYLKQYVKLLKTAMNKLSTAHELTLQQSQSLQFQVLLIWKTYIVKRRQINHPLAGMFKRYISTQNKEKIKDNKNEVLNQSHPHISSEKQSDSSHEQVIQTNKRKRGSSQKKQKSGKSLSITTKFRSYYNITVKPLIHQSIEQRKIEKNQLTSSQKSFLSYLLAIEQEVSYQFLTVCSLKYLKLLLKLHGKPTQKSFIKQGQIVFELKLRNSACLKKRQESILLILLIDMLFCSNYKQAHIDYSLNLKQLLQLYQKSQQSCRVINQLVGTLNKNNTNKSKCNVPEINYQLIYTIMNLASLRIGLCLTIPEIVIGCEKLQIYKIALDEEVAVDGVPNEEAITAQKIRKNTHLLASFLSYQPIFSIQKWSNKLCRILGLQMQNARISSINRLLFKELQLSQCKNDSQGFYYSQEGKMIKYHRHLWIQQDIACLTAIFIFIKLSTGLTLYPYLINFPVKSINASVKIANPQFLVAQALIKNREIKIQNTVVTLLKKLFLPQFYKNQINLMSISRNLTALSQKDKYFSCESFNKSFIRLRNLSHINGVGSNDLITILNFAKKNQYEDKQYQIQLKYDEHQHKQFTRQLAQKYKNLKPKKLNKQANKIVGRLNNNLIRQVSCIVSKTQKIVYEGQPKINQQCRLDYPSTNYQLMYEYSQQNLTLSKRVEQLYFMELLCLNICSFSELSNWLIRYENILKQFEM